MRRVWAVLASWEGARRRLAFSATWLVLLAGAATLSHPTVMRPYVGMCFAPVLALFLASLAQLALLRLRAPQSPLPPSVVEASRAKFDPQAPGEGGADDAVTRGGEGLKV